MTQSDLRAAAERVRRVNSGEPQDVVYGTSQYDLVKAYDLLCYDRHDLSEAYLAANPPDGETEIDEAWLVSVGGERRADGKWFDFRFRDAGDNEQLLTWYRHGIAMIGDRIGLRCKTRSDLRGLCAALGIPLKEEKEA